MAFLLQAASRKPSKVFFQEFLSFCFLREGRATLIVGTDLRVGQDRFLDIYGFARIHVSIP